MSTLSPDRAPGVLTPDRANSLTVPVLVMAAWFIVVYLAGATGVFEGSDSEPPWRIALAVVLPVGAVGAGLALSPGFRAWAQSLDLALLTHLQAWRLGGFVFISFWASGLLPGSFAIPASLGDAAIAITAPFMARHLVRRGAEARPLFLAWTAFGIADLVAAVTLGVLNSAAPWAFLSDQVTTTDLVTRLPVVLIPAFGVPLMLVLHLLSLANLRAQPWRRAG